MGWGDEIMAAGQARAEWRRTGKRVEIRDRAGRRRWHEMWAGLDYIARPGEAGPFAHITNGSNCRPYIRYPFTVESGIAFTAWRARDQRGEIRLTPEELSFGARVRSAAGGPFVLVEPNIRVAPGVPNVNKDWGIDRWQQVVDALPEVRFVQPAAPGELRTLSRVLVYRTDTFRHACAALYFARGAALLEGGLHHAAAALGVPAVVLFGGSPSVEALGYPDHANLAAPDNGCGRWLPCDHCRSYWDALEPETVANAVRSMLAAAKG